MWAPGHLSHVLSTDKLRKPASRAVMDRRAVPANTSTISKSLIGLPEKRENEFGEIVDVDWTKLALGLETSPSLVAPRAEFKESPVCSSTTIFVALELLFFCHAVFLPATLRVASPWLVRKHFAHLWTPFGQRLPLVLQPFAKLKAQQMFSLLSSLWWCPFTSSGHNAVAFLVGGFLGFGALSSGSPCGFEISSLPRFSTPEGLDFGSGSKCIVTLGSTLNCFMASSIGKVPVKEGLREPLISFAIMVKSSRSAFTTCSIFPLP